jgi:protoheme IX farnesyltransferase
MLQTKDGDRFLKPSAICDIGGNMPWIIKKYIGVAKPGIILGNLISTSGGFLLASRGDIDAGTLQAVLGGMALMVASGCVLNNLIDRNLDRKMDRTRNRVLAAGRMTPVAAALYASLLGIAGSLLLWMTTNPLCVGLVLAGLGVYVIAYSLVLKPRSMYSTLIGSLAGAAPPLTGYCAVTGRFDAGAWILLSIFSLWQMAHAHTIAVWRFTDFAAAAVPSLAGRRGVPAAKKHIAVYILAFWAAASTLTIGGYAGFGFLAAVCAIGLLWLLMALKGIKTDDDVRWAGNLYTFSIVGITILSVMMAIDH